MSTIARVPRDNTARGITLMVCTMVVFACQDGITKHLSTVLPIPMILWMRFTGFLLFGLWLQHRQGGRKTMRSARPWLQLTRGVVLLVEMAGFVLCVRYLPLAETHAILSSTPLLVTVLSVPVLGEVVGIRRWLAVLAGFGGVLIILRPGLGVMQPAELFAVAVAFLYALFIVVTRLLSRHDGAATTLVHTGAVGVLAMSCTVPFVWQTPDRSALLFLLAVGCTGTFSHWLLIQALEAAPASLLQPYSYTVLVWATLVGFVFFGNLPDGFTIAGACIIVASGIYTWYRERLRAIG